MSDGETVISITTAPPPPPPYDWRKSVWKGVKAGAVSLGGIAAAGALDALVRAASDQAVVTGLFGTLAGKPWALAAVPLIVGATHALDNRRKQRKAAAEAAP